MNGGPTLRAAVTGLASHMLMEVGLDARVAEGTRNGHDLNHGHRKWRVGVIVWVGVEKCLPCCIEPRSQACLTEGMPTFTDSIRV